MDDSIPPPPWRQPAAPQQSAAPIPQPTEIPPPPWRAGSESLGASPALDQLSQQIQQTQDAQAATLAKGEIAARQSGQQLLPAPQQPTGANDLLTTTYTPQQVQPAAPVSAQDKGNINQAYQQAIAGHAAPQSAEDLDAQVKAVTRSQNTPMQNFGGGVMQTFGGVASGLRGVVNPEGGVRQNENIANTFESDPDSNASMAGRLAAGATMAAAGSSNPGVVAGIFGAQTFGDVRNEVARLRSAGQNITPTQEYMAAGGQALATFLTSKVGASYNQGLGKSLLAQNAALRQEGASVVANTIKQYALASGVGLGDMQAMTLANNVIAQQTYDPTRDTSQGIGESSLLGAIAGPAGLIGHGGGLPHETGPEKPSVPIAPDAIKEATPTPEQLATLKSSPAPDVNNTDGALPPSVEAKKTKFRIQDGANSRGVEVQFEDPNDKALYVATDTRKGKLQADAISHLKDQGYSEEAIGRYGDDVRGRLDEAAKGFDGDVLKLPKAPEVDEAVAGRGAEEPTQPEVKNAEGTVGTSERQAAPVEDVAGDEVARQDGNSRLQEGDEGKNAAGVDSVSVGTGEAAGEGEGVKNFLPSKAEEDTAVKAAGGMVKNFKRVAPPSKDHADAAKVFAKRGVKVVYFQGEGKGFRMKRYPGVLFVNADKPVASFREAISHEFIHELHDTRPGLFHELSDAVGPEERAKWEEWYAGEFDKMRPGEKPAALNEEGVTTPIGKLASSNERVWTAAMGKDPTLLQKIGDFARPFLAKFSSKSRQIQAAVKAFDATLKNPIGENTKVNELSGTTHLPGETDEEKTARHEEIRGAATAFEGNLREQTGVNRLAETKGKLDELSSKQDEQLAERPDFLPGQKFLDEDAKPAIKAAVDAVKKSWEGVKALVAPFTRSKAAKATALILRERGGELAQRFGRLDEAFHKARDLFTKMNTTDSRQFIADIEAGKKTTIPELQPIADAVRAILDDRLHQVQALGTGKLAAFVQDYFPHLWEDPTGKAAKAWQDAVTKAPLQGKKSFLKSRTLPTFADGIARGLKPITENPIEAMMLRVREMDKYITAHEAFKEMRSSGLLKKVRARDVAKNPGYAKIDDNIATVFAKPSRRGAIQVAGYYMAPESVANVVNNYLSPGLKSNKLFGGLFRGYLGAGNTMNQAQLGLSFFHAAFVSYDSAVSSFAIGLKNLAKGRVATGGRQIGEALTLVAPSIRSWRNGTQIMKEWNSPGSTTPDIAAVVDAMKAGGGRITMDEFHRTGWRASLAKAWKAGNVLGASLRLPGAALEAVSAPVLEKMVPRIKAGVFFDMAQHELANLGPNPDRMAMRDAMAKAWDSVDNRMGELVYDNLFWNKTVKDLAMASTRSVGWNLGTLREVGGGIMDAATNAGSVAFGRGRNAEFTHRAAYTVALPLMTGIMGAILHKMMTGDNPKELKDYFFPKTGQKDKDGHDVRLTLPSYMKDVFSYQADPVTTLKNKTHPMLNSIMEMLSNKDYYGTKIRNEDDPYVKQAIDLAKHAGEGFVPFGAREAVKLQSEGQGAKSLLPLVGVTTARRDITNSPAELMASKLAGENVPAGSRTSQDADKASLVRDYGARVKANDPNVVAEIKQAIQDGKLTHSSIDAIKDHAKYSGFERTVKHLDVVSAMKVWDVATPDERRVMAPFLIPHALHTDTLPADQKKSILERLAADWATLKK